MIKKRSYMFSLFLTFSLFFCSYANLFSQINPLIEEKLIERDRSQEIKNPHHIECVAYRMKEGDTAFYRTVNSDSIMVFGEEAPLLRQRIELHSLHCDSVRGDRIFYTQRLEEYISMESKGYVMDVKRTEHPWSEVEVYVEIDSMGYRYSSQISDSSVFRQSPGGAFQPTILPILDFGCRFIGEKWGTDYENRIAENGYPSPNWEESLFYVMFPPKDTLGTMTQSLELNRTAVCELTIPFNETDYMQVVNSKNSYGTIYFTYEVPMPILQEVTSENKMKIYGSAEEPTETHHFYDTKIILEKYVNSHGEIIYTNYPE